MYKLNFDILLGLGLCPASGMSAQLNEGKGL